jgi:flagellar M-ring protein FliF
MENAPAPANTVTPTIPVPTTPLGAMQTNVSRQPVMKQIAFLFAIAASIAVGGYVLMWAQTPNYQVLFNDLSARESSDIVAVLQQTDTAYKLDASTGALMVPASKVQSLRMTLAAEGLPRSASPGMEMLNQDQGFGTSQFIERARYQHAMEEELSRSISEIYNVKSARVHLAVPKQSVFVRERKPPSASVVVNLYAGRNLDPNQVAAVTHMVASSVPNMSNKDVTIVDQKGNLLTKPDRDEGLMLSDTQLQYTQKLEQKYIQRIEDILAPIVGTAGVRAQVMAEVDFTMTEQTHESYNPDSVVMRSEQLQEESRTGGAAEALGVPGALTNQPPAGGQPQETITAEGGGVSAVAGTPGSSSKQSTRNFEMDRTISHTRVAPGSIRKLSVAVLVDERREPGSTESTPLSEAEMTRINALIMDAIGFNQARGDSLNVVNAPFMTLPEQEAVPEIPIWDQPWVWDIAKQGLGGLLVLFLIFGVIRPAFKDLNKVHVDPEAQAAVQSLLANQAGGGGGSEERIVTGSEDVEGQLANVRSLVQQDPALVAQVIKNWTVGES